MNYENKVLNYMKDNSDSITVEELNKLNIPRITLTRLTDKKLIEYKCLIDDKVIKIMAFSKYSVIAEKFETLIETLETDTRAKDFYDIYKLMINNIDKEKLYKNMVDARADWLYELPQWEKIFDENTRKRLYKEQKNSGTIRKEKKIGRNDPCPCGSGKKYKYCCGANK